MTPEDVPAVVEVQAPAAIVGLAAVFPQEQHPFPRDEVAQRWLEEIATADIDCFVIVHGSVISGFAAVRGDELLHFGTALDHWGTGLAQRAHDELLDTMRSRGVPKACLRVFTDNGRGRSFYENLGWRATDQRSRSAYPPFPELLRYERSLSDR